MPPKEADLEEAEMRADRVEERLAEYLRQCALGKKGNDAGPSYFLKIPESGTREAWKGELMKIPESGTREAWKDEMMQYT